MNFDEIFWKASVEELKKGYVYLDENLYVCLCCEEKFEEGVIYPQGKLLMDAKKAIETHIIEKHQSMFHFLFSMDKKYTSLTDNQKQLVEMFYEGLSDKEIMQKVGGSASTIRNQRFTLREKAKQAKIFLAFMELLEQKMSSSQQLIPIHRSATNVDERYAITEEERTECLKKYFEESVLLRFPKKQKRIIIVLQYIVSFFERKHIYSEKEVNAILKEIYSDYVTIRRYLIEYGFLDRKADGSEYWIK